MGFSSYPVLVQQFNVENENRAARIVTNSPYDASALPLIKQLGWLNIQQMIEFETTKIVHKTLHNEVPEYLQGLFTRVSDKCVRELRNSKLDEMKCFHRCENAVAYHRFWTKHP